MFRLVLLSSFCAMSLALAFNYSFLVNHEDSNNDHKRNKRATTCKAGYTFSSQTGFCYKYVSAAASFTNALIACRNDGGDLISILAPSENDMLNQMALANGGLQKVWIGFVLNTNYVWEWADKYPVVYTNWYQNYPGANNMAGCPAIRAPWSIPNKACADFQPAGFPCNGGASFWENAYDCTQPLPYVCKQRGCDSNACNNACINRGCQSGFCNIGCTNPDDPNAPCNPAFVRTCTCDFCTTTPCAQPGNTDVQGNAENSFAICASIGCDSGDCFEGLTLCVGCPATNTATPSWQYRTTAMGTCTPSACNTYCQQHGCVSGGCDLFYSGVADNPCACDTCLNPTQTCTQAACNATCGAAGFGCHHGNCNQGICGCFVCPNNYKTGK